MLQKNVKPAEIFHIISASSIWTLKVSAVSEVAFFFILLVYALTGLTYNFKDMDEFMLATWIAYFLSTFRLDMNYEM